MEQQHPIDKAGSTTSFSSEDAFPEVSLPAEKLKLLINVIVVKRMKIMLMWQNECWLVMFSRAKWIKLIIIQLARDNSNTINESNNTAFDKPSIFVTRDSYYYLVQDSDILENIVDLIHKEGLGIYLAFFICSTHKGPITVMARV